MLNACYNVRILLLQSFNEKICVFFVIKLSRIISGFIQKVLMPCHLSTSILFLLYDFTTENPASQKQVVAKGIRYFMTLFAGVGN
jgi:hypothetical protein